MPYVMHLTCGGELGCLPNEPKARVGGVSVDLPPSVSSRCRINGFQDEFHSHVRPLIDQQLYSADCGGLIAPGGFYIHHNFQRLAV